MSFMNKIAEFKMQSYADRMELVKALNNCGYATYIDERKEKNYYISSDFYVVVYAVNKKEE